MVDEALLINETFFSLEEIQRIDESNDPLAIAIRGHKLLELGLTIAILEGFAKTYKPEIERLSFGFKVELAIALGMLPADFKAGLLKLNKIRNDFAHAADSKFELRDAQDLLNSMPVQLKEMIAIFTRTDKSAHKVLAASFASTCLILVVQIERTRDEKVRTKEWVEMAMKVVEDLEAKGDMNKHTAKYEKLVEEKVRSSKEQRKSSGRI